VVTAAVLEPPGDGVVKGLDVANLRTVVPALVRTDPPPSTSAKTDVDQPLLQIAVYP
jgi:hypothetical protein